MGWGNPMPLAELKRNAAAMVRVSKRAEEAERKLELIQRLIDRNRVAVPTHYLRMALGPQDRCAQCLSAYVECPVHGLTSTDGTTSPSGHGAGSRDE